MAEVVVTPSNNDKKESPPVNLKQKLYGHSGFASLPEQLGEKMIRNGFVFNILCIGETGIGKSTLMDSLFNTSFDSSPSPHNQQTTSIKGNLYMLEESRVRLKLTIAESVGYGDQINRENSVKYISKYIDNQFEDYLKEEMKISRSLATFPDKRIHACLYFIRPNSHGLTAIDQLALKEIHRKVNVIPIIAKSDCMSKRELEMLKAKIKAEIESISVEVYQSPPDDESVSEDNAAINNYVPMAIVASTDFLYINDKLTRCREYPWGIVEVENDSQNDFVRLREMLIRSNMEDMREITENVFYERYRQERLKELKYNNALAHRLANTETVEDEKNASVSNDRIAEYETKDADEELVIKPSSQVSRKFEVQRQDCMTGQKKWDESQRKSDDETKKSNDIKSQAPVTCQLQCTMSFANAKQKKSA